MRSFVLSTAEHIRQVLRPSKAALLPKLAVFCLVVLLPGIYLYGYELPGPVVKLGLVWVMVWVVWFGWHIIRWSLERYIITNYRLVVIAHTSPLKRFVEETPLERILNVGLAKSGVLEMAFGLGTVLVRAIGLEEPLKLRHLRGAPKVVRYLWQENKRIKEEKGGAVEMSYDRNKQYE